MDHPEDLRLTLMKFQEESEIIQVSFQHVVERSDQLICWIEWGEKAKELNSNVDIDRFIGFLDLAIKIKIPYHRIQSLMEVRSLAEEVQNIQLLKV